MNNKMIVNIPTSVVMKEISFGQKFMQITIFLYIEN